eukprot:Platyproteum_vivax@DN644_c0_g1_i2.p1
MRSNSKMMCCLFLIIVEGGLMRHLGCRYMKNFPEWLEKCDRCEEVFWVEWEAKGFEGRSPTKTRNKRKSPPSPQKGESPPRKIEKPNILAAVASHIQKNKSEKEKQKNAKKVTKVEPIEAVEVKEVRTPTDKVRTRAKTQCWVKECDEALRELSRCKDSSLQWFRRPVLDFKEHNNAAFRSQYLSVVTHPMDLGTVQKTLKDNGYNSPKEFLRDIELVWDNACKFNPAGHQVHIAAKHYLTLWNSIWSKHSAASMLKDISSEVEDQREPVVVSPSSISPLFA